ncbi:hypothetical protein ACKWTF_008933 [Chironomus riparius]
MSTIRSIKYRESLKQPENREKYEQYLLRRKKNNQNYIHKQLMNKKTAKVFIRKQQQRTKKCRDRKKSKNSKGPIESAFPSISARSKAVIKAQKSLPMVLNKRKEVVGILAERNGITEMKSKVLSIKPRRGFPEIEVIVLISALKLNRKITSIKLNKFLI